MYNYYNQEEIEILRAGGKILAQIMKELKNFIKEGTIIADIDREALRLIKKYNALPATVNYQPKGAPFPFPSAVCVSVNNEVAHGISTDRLDIIKSGDIVSADIVIQYQGLFVDICRSWGIGKLSQADKKLLQVARETTDQAIKMAVIGKTTDDIGARAEQVAKKYNFQTVKELGGHGVGRKIHDIPFIPSFKNSGYRDKIKEGMVLAIEPIVNAGDWKIKSGQDGYIYLTADGKKSAQFEETVLITKNGPEILTKL